MGADLAISGLSTRNIESSVYQLFTSIEEMTM